MEVYDGASATGRLKGKFSGSATPPMQIATSGSMLIRFTSDGSAAQGGFSMTWVDGIHATAVPPLCLLRQQGVSEHM